MSVTANRPLMVGETINCKISSYAPGNTFTEQVYPVITEAIIPLKPELNTVICEISGPAKTLELLVKYQPDLAEEFIKIEAMITQLKMTDLKFREMEPDSKLCSFDQVAPKKSFVVSSKLTHGSVGEFCASPMEMSPGIFAVACDASRNETWNGYVNIFNDKMLLIKKTKILSPQHDQPGFEWTNAVDHTSRPLVINKQAIFTTNDGRLLYFSTDGIKLREIKLPFLYLSNPQMLAESFDTFAILGADSINDPDHKSLLIIKNDRLIKTVELDTINDISSFHVLADRVYLVTYLGEILQVDFEGQILHKLHLEKNRLSPLLIQASRILIGSDSGRLYEIDHELKGAKLIYRAFYDGRTDYDVGLNQDYAIRPNFALAPGVLKNGKIVIASENDGRIHFLDDKGNLEKIVSIPFVRDLLAFGIFSTLDGEEYIAASSISYLEVLSTKGDIVAESISTGAEIFDTPKRISSGQFANQFLMGMYNGVFRYSLNPVSGKTVTTKIVRPCP